MKRLVKLVARLATRRGTMVGLAAVVAAVVVPLALRGSSRGTWQLPTAEDARGAVAALRDRVRPARELVEA